MRSWIVLLCRPLKPVQRLGAIWRHTHAVYVGEAQIVLGASMAQFRRFGIPGKCLRMVLLHALPVAVHQAKVELGPCMALLRSLAIPQQRMRIVLCAPAVAEDDAKIELRVGMAAVGRLAKPGARLLPVLRHAVAAAVHHAQAVGFVSL